MRLIYCEWGQFNFSEENCYFQMHNASRDYCVEMIQSHEPTETGKKRHEFGIDGQYISILYMIRILYCQNRKKPALCYVVRLVTRSAAKSRHEFSWRQRGRVFRAPDLKSGGRGSSPVLTS